jgi:predicted oxidoreductase (fatty acid repression mutant protein)
MENDFIFAEDIKYFEEILHRFSILQDNDYESAFNLHKDALASYDRWSTIYFEVRKAELGSKKNPALKDRIEQILRVLNNIYTSSRMVFGRAKEDSAQKRY